MLLNGSPSGRDESASAACPERVEHVATGGHDLRGAAMIRRQSDHLDAGEPIGDVGEEQRVRAVEAVDRLRRIPDQVEVVPSADDELEQPELDGVQVLRLVHEDVPEAPPHGLRPPRVSRELGGRHREQVVEVDDAAPALEGGEGGETLGDPLRCRRDPAARGADRGRIVVRGHAARTGPVGLPGERRHRHAGRDLGEQTVAIADDGRGMLVELEPPLPEQPEGDGVERARLDAFAQSGPAQAAAQLAGGLPRERQGEGVPRVGRSGGDAVGDAARQYPGLS